MNITEQKMYGPPMTCRICLRKCGGRDMPAAYPVRLDGVSAWLCEKHYQELYPPEVDNSEDSETKDYTIVI